MIKPTVGRVVWYFPAVGDVGLACRGAHPCAAIVAFVWHDRMVNLTVFDHNGQAQSRMSVLLLQEGDPRPAPEMAYAEWMPFQKGQAMKTEALEKQQRG